MLLQRAIFVGEHTPVGANSLFFSDTPPNGFACVLQHGVMLDAADRRIVSPIPRQRASRNLQAMPSGAGHVRLALAAAFPTLRETPRKLAIPAVPEGGITRQCRRFLHS